ALFGCSSGETANAPDANGGGGAGGSGTGGAGGSLPDAGVPDGAASGCDGGIPTTCAVRFVYTRNDAQSVELRGDFSATGWTQGVALSRNGNAFEATVQLADQHVVHYKQLPDGSRGTGHPEA